LTQIVITGASGFLGQNVAKRLIEAGHRCILLDLNEIGDQRLAQTVLEGRALFCRCDLGDRSTLLPVLDLLNGPAYLVHLASRVEATREFTGLDAHFGVHLDPIFGLMEVFGQSLEGVCFASTIETYGFPQRLPIDESHPTVPFNLYGVGKLNAEHLLRIYCERAELPQCVLRLSHIYGPGETYRKAIPVFIEHCLRNRDVTLQAGGRERRDFVHVDDIARAISLAIERKANGIYTISGGQSVAIREALEIIMEQCGANISVHDQPASRPGIDYEFDLSHARGELGYEPQVSLAEGLKSEIEWFEERLV
jgi:nucleoside-diphosphate-sugar epimerase